MNPGVPDAERQAFIAAWRRGESNTALAARFGILPSAVRSRVWRWNLPRRIKTRRQWQRLFEGLETRSAP